VFNRAPELTVGSVHYVIAAYNNLEPIEAGASSLEAGHELAGCLAALSSQLWVPQPQESSRAQRPLSLCRSPLGGWGART
jgi:hypothetical protein